ncbi:MAG: transglycosylase domain-containing protein, partial [Deltaproteobacteria bacterium]|nr:transglycosylase domain-containing protein [Deltaproteobacteria bacterium]
MNTKIKRKAKKENHKKKRFELTPKKIVLYSLTAVSGAMALGTILILGLFYYYSHTAGLPSVETLRNYKPLQSTRISDRNGKLIGFLGKKKRTVVPYSRIPDILVKAIISAEDASFFDHKGLNLLGMMRAFWINIAAGRFKQGGSTITQQVVKGLLLSPERTLRRKFQEVILARRLEQTLSKKEILSIYLNEIYFGHGRYGVEEASLFYFGKHVWELDASESAVLAGLPQGPELNSPIKHPDRSRKRQLYVLGQMKKHGYISEDTYKSAVDSPLPVVKKSSKLQNAPEMMDMVRRYINENNLDLQGKHVITTVDLEMQSKALDALSKGLKEYDKRQRVTRLVNLKGKKLKKYLQKLKKAGEPGMGKIYEGVVTARDGESLIINLGNIKGIIEEGMDRYYPRGYTFGNNSNKKKKKKTKSKKSSVPHISPGDLIRVRLLEGKTDNEDAPLRLRAEIGPQGGVVLIDIESAEIRALIGGLNMTSGGFNRAVMAKRQPGSSFKPFVYAAAISSGKFTAATLLNDGPEVYKKWIPRNHGNFKGNITLREALAHSVNSIAVHILSKTGVQSVISIAKSAGIKSKLGRELSLALGTSEVTLLELASAYRIFAANGYSRSPVFIKTINGVQLNSSEARRVLKGNTAYIMKSILGSVVRDGTARRAANMKFTVFGKTGTTN